MGVTNSNKVINTDRIPCDGTLRVTLALTAAPDIVSNPTDIVLVLDRSGSMTGTPLADMKVGAKTFIDLIDEATDSSQDGQIGSGSRMGVVSFSNTAVADTQLITSVDVLKAAVDDLSAGGSTNHADRSTTSATLAANWSRSRYSTSILVPSFSVQSSSVSQKSLSISIWLQ